MAIVSVSLPDDLLIQADALIRAGAFNGRSELVRAALRDLVAAAAQRADTGGERTATMTLVYPEGHERRIGEIRHEYGDVVKTFVHADTPASCTEVFVLQGDGARIRQFTQRLRANRETRLVQTVFTDA